MQRRPTPAVARIQPRAGVNQLLYSLQTPGDDGEMQQRSIAGDLSIGIGPASKRDDYGVRVAVNYRTC